MHACVIFLGFGLLQQQLYPGILYCRHVQHRQILQEKSPLDSVRVVAIPRDFVAQNRASHQNAEIHPSMALLKRKAIAAL